MFQNQHSDTGKAEPISGFGEHGWGELPGNLGTRGRASLSELDH